MRKFENIFYRVFSEFNSDSKYINFMSLSYMVGSVFFNIRKYRGFPLLRRWNPENLEKNFIQNFKLETTFPNLVSDFA